MIKKFKRERIVIYCMVTLILSGCAGTKEPDSQNVKDEVVTETFSQEETTLEEDKVPLEALTTEQDTTTEDETTTEETVDAKVDTAVDYDLTQMGSDMVYATVYQMMVDPATYEGKTVKISGTYYGAWYEPTSKYYFYVIISDAMACCSQGMEFVWDDGSHVYPDEYPADGSEVEVTGTFETYKEEGNDALYCRLRDASLNVK